MLQRAVLLALALLLAGGVSGAGEITTGSLVTEMVDLVRLSEFPDPPYRTVQYSSYDHRSRVPNTPEWFANSDGFGREPLPNFEKILKKPGSDGVGEYLMAEVEGPGVITRGWTARINGEIRLHLDGSGEPVYSGPAGEFLLDLYGHYAEKLGLDPGDARDVFHQRCAQYFPIPFGKGCRIVWKGKVADLHFYQIQIRHYAAGTPVRTFRPDDLKTYAAEIKKAAGALANPDSLTAALKNPQRWRETFEIPPEKTTTILDDSSGPRVIRSFSVKLQAPDRVRALRGTILRIRFDGAPRPQVESPLGDFFGAAPGINPYVTVPMTVRGDGKMTCRLAMPYRRSAHITLENWSGSGAEVETDVAATAYTWIPGRSLHFRARWRASQDLLASPGGVFDLPFLIALGKGVYVGTVSYIMNPSPVPTAYGNWWGEGDEKVFVDGEKFPSTFGTGTEDYYNYAWSSPDLFEHPHFAQPVVTGPDCRGYTTNNRWHLLDALPFTSEISFYIEVYPHRPTPGLSYARMSYHYGLPGIRDDHVPIQKRDAFVPPLPRAWKPVASHGSRGATFFQAEDLERKPEDRARVVEGDTYAGGKLVQWNPGGPGETLEFRLRSPGGRRAVVLTAAMTPASGKVRLRVDGKPVKTSGGGDAADLYTPHQTMLRNFFWRPLDLGEGEHAITLESAGKGEKSAGGQIGIDFFWLIPR